MLLCLQAPGVELTRGICLWYPQRMNATSRPLSAMLGLTLGLALAAGLAPRSAHAGNGAHIRTPVDWSGAPCMTVIDRSLDPNHAFDYAVPFEDTALTDDEVADSRTHQFFAFCRDRYHGSQLPGWVSEPDVEAAVNKGLGDPSELDLELDVLANAPDWAECWTAITADAERRPITFASAAAPVVWDTSGLAPGTWVIDGYTHEPWTNLWTAHPGVVKIVDDPDPAASGPAASLDFAELEVDFGELAPISGCVHAMPGTTMSLSWALATINGEPSWVEFAAEVAVEGASFELNFEPPAETVSNPVLIRADLLDPMGRSWTAYSRNVIGVQDAGSSEGCDEGGFVGGPCGDTETGSAPSETGAPADEDSAGGGCNCSTHARGDQALGWAWGLALVGLIRRRRR